MAELKGSNSPERKLFEELLGNTATLVWGDPGQRIFKYPSWEYLMNLRIKLRSFRDFLIFKVRRLQKPKQVIAEQVKVVAIVAEPRTVVSGITRQPSNQTARSKQRKPLGSAHYRSRFCNGQVTVESLSRLLPFAVL